MFLIKSLRCKRAPELLQQRAFQLLEKVAERISYICYRLSAAADTTVPMHSTTVPTLRTLLEASVVCYKGCTPTHAELGVRL